MTARKQALKKLGENRRRRHQNKWDVKFLEQRRYCRESTAGGLRLPSVHSFCLLIEYRKAQQLFPVNSRSAEAEQLGRSVVCLSAEFALLKLAIMASSHGGIVCV